MSTIPPRWYMLNNIGMATLCSSEADAKLEVANANEYFPRMAPHRAVQLVDAADLATMAAHLSECRAALDSLLAKNPGLTGVVCGSTTLGNLRAELGRYRRNQPTTAPAATTAAATLAA